MMTTMAALLGGVPLMLGTGTGSEIRQPLGYAMVGGLFGTPRKQNTKCRCPVRSRGCAPGFRPTV